MLHLIHFGGKLLPKTYSMAGYPERLFTDEVIDDVRNSWAVISGDLQIVGLEIFRRLFAAYPTYQQLFNAFKNVPIDQLEKNQTYLSHAKSVAGALNSAIQKLHDPATVIPLLKTVGANHVKRNVSSEHYSNAEKIILDAVAFLLRDIATERILASWKEVLQAAVSMIIQGNKEEDDRFM